MKVNGKEIVFAPVTLLEYLLQQQYDPARVVVERNMEIITKERFAEVMLAEEDDINILQFMGGG